MHAFTKLIYFNSVNVYIFIKYIIYLKKYTFKLIKNSCFKVLYNINFLILKTI